MNEQILAGICIGWFVLSMIGFFAMRRDLMDRQGAIDSGEFIELVILALFAGPVYGLFFIGKKIVGVFK